MNQYRWEALKKDEINPSLSRQAIHSDTMTLARFEVRKGGMVPEHSHHNEQITTLHAGRMQFNLEGKQVILEPGESLQIPSHLPHSAVALEDSVIFEVFSPPRQDWINGETGYSKK